MPPGSGQAKKQIPQPVQSGSAVLGGVVAVVVEVLGEVQDAGRAGLDAKTAAFAFLRVNFDRSFIRSHGGRHDCLLFNERCAPVEKVRAFGVIV